MDKKRVNWIIVLGIILLILVLGFFWFLGGDGEKDVVEKCVPASCCHSTSCVLESGAPNCSGSFCTMSCEPGTLDCGQARCEYVNGSCEVILNE